jgi:hypothetical protein
LRCHFKNAKPGVRLRSALPGLWVLDLWPLGSIVTNVGDVLHINLRGSVGIQRDNDVTFTTPAFDLNAPRQ